MEGEQVATSWAATGVTLGSPSSHRVTIRRGEKSNELRGTRVRPGVGIGDGGGWWRCGSTVDMAVAAALLVDRSCRQREREREIEWNQTVHRV